MRNQLFRPVLAILALVVGCDADNGPVLPIPTTCSTLGWPVTPSSATLVTGDTIRLRTTLIDFCSGSSAVLEPYWSSNAPTIASVDSVSGLVTARSVGATSIVVRAVKKAEIAAAMVVTVTK